jgi:DNA-binding MarR family transcriptional regulator
MTLAEQVASLRRTLHRRLNRELLRSTERPFLQLNALRVITREKLTTQAELAERLVVDAPAISRAVAKLEADGLLQRLAGADRRSVRLKVTPAGKKALAALETSLVALEDQVVSALSASEYRQLMAGMRKLQDALCMKR